jgi:hypothetical protein
MACIRNSTGDSTDIASVISKQKVASKQNPSNSNDFTSHKDPECKEDAIVSQRSVQTRNLGPSTAFSDIDMSKVKDIDQLVAMGLHRLRFALQQRGPSSFFFFA